MLIKSFHKLKGFTCWGPIAFQAAVFISSKTILSLTFLPCSYQTHLPITQCGLDSDIAYLICWVTLSFCGWSVLLRFILNKWLVAAAQKCIMNHLLWGQADHWHRRVTGAAKVFMDCFGKYALDQYYIIKFAINIFNNSFFFLTVLLCLLDYLFALLAALGVGQNEPQPNCDEGPQSPQSVMWGRLDQLFSHKLLLVEHVLVLHLKYNRRKVTFIPL